MTRRIAPAVAVLAYIAAGLALLHPGARPLAQLDLFVQTPFTPDLDTPAVANAVAKTVDELGADRANAMVPRLFGFEAHAGHVEGAVLRAVSVETIGANRVRITVAAHDVPAAHRVADSVRQGFAGDGMRERLRIMSEASGGLALLFARLMAAFGTLALLCHFMVWAVMRTQGTGKGSAKRLAGPSVPA